MYNKRIICFRKLLPEWEDGLISRMTIKLCIHGLWKVFGKYYIVWRFWYWEIGGYSNRCMIKDWYIEVTRLCHSLSVAILHYQTLRQDKITKMFPIQQVS